MENMKFVMGAIIGVIFLHSLPCWGNDKCDSASQKCHEDCSKKAANSSTALDDLNTCWDNCATTAEKCIESQVTKSS